MWTKYPYPMVAPNYGTTISACEVERLDERFRRNHPRPSGRFVTMKAIPCPFCTSCEVRPYETDEARVVMKCEDCGASGPVCIDEVNAVESWNYRPSAQPE
ncbi:hypothetical protein EB231_33760 [Mesorhizobium sp. NZP2298]|uniref:Restriction alleviation protein, Lar family n=1 Tax=Mesorhizobium helmanticense TaxID=1776423 RepID=A0A2T4IN62_9HYPH|nr:hypothetical protein C9427_27530 [Mesorhizobium helmanticense]QKC92480.1 hypothetical protein EB230_32115 [Mesorhizobium sp. NZP2234]QKC99002.1 hypothetical protein EB231_33760 [Mesorhizobium sp. NZP2298]